jgi:threonine dehydratase
MNMFFFIYQEGTFLVHPFDQPDTWAGHSTLVHELYDQLKGQV